MYFSKNTNLCDLINKTNAKLILDELIGEYDPPTACHPAIQVKKKKLMKGKQKFPDSKKVATMGLNLSDISKPKKKDKGRTPQSIATEVDYLKKRQKVAPYGAKYTG